MTEAETVKVNVRGMAVGGSGVGEVCEQSDGGKNLLGITAFVPYSAAGEVVEARVTQKKERYLKTELLSVEKSSSARVEPKCAYYTQCGGCDLQHVSYEAELEAKNEMILGNLRAAKLGQGVLDSLRPIMAGEPYTYRRRVSLHIDASGRVGFYRSSSRSLVEISRCEIADEQINSSLEAAKILSKEIAGKISSINLEADYKGVVAVLKTTYQPSRGEINEIIEKAKKRFENACIMHGNKEIAGFGRQILELSLAPAMAINLKIPAGGFSQVNELVNARMISYVTSFASSGDRVLDLFSGAGNFSIPFAKTGAHVEAVECDERLCIFLKKNAESYKLSNRVKVHSISTEKFLSPTFLKGEASKYDLVIADPPRSGLSSMVSKMKFGKTLVLISCDLPSFSRDTRGLLEKGWEPEEIQPFDMFSRTSHVEIVGVFRRS